MKRQFSLHDNVVIKKNKVQGKIDEICLFRRENRIGYRVYDNANKAWYYVSDDEITKDTQ